MLIATSVMNTRCALFQEKIYNFLLWAKEPLKFFRCTFDESLYLITQMGLKDLVVNFWHTVINKVSTGYLYFTAIGHGPHKYLLLHFASVVDFLDKSNLLQVSEDGPNENWAETILIVQLPTIK